MNNKKSIFLTFMLLLLLSGCDPVFLYKSDYSFYTKGFALDKSSLLRTDGFYQLEGDFDGTSGSSEKLETYEVYKFYKTGQANFILVDSLEDNAFYFDAMKSQIEKYGRNKNEYTLFQGYYKIDGEKLVIQQVNITTGNFVYLYGLVSEDSLIFVNRTIDGKGEFRSDYFTGPSKMIYRFTPYQRAEKELSPNW